MIEFEYTITLQEGLHAAPAVQLASTAQRLESRVTVRNKRGKSASALHPLQLMRLFACCGESVTVRVEGCSEKADAERLRRYFEEYL